MALLPPPKGNGFLCHENFMKYMLIVNPKAGKIKSRNRLFHLVRTFNEEDQCHLYVTQKAHDATEMIRKFSSDYDRIITVGGDGTFNEVITGLLRYKINLPIGYIPAGTTNDFARSQQLPKKLDRAIKMIRYGSLSPVDIGQWNQNFFSYVASIGAFTAVAYNTPQSLKNRFGYFAYLTQIFKHIPSIKRYNISYTYNHQKIDEQVLFLSISNATSIGGFIHLNPSSIDLNDGKLELFYIRYPAHPIDWIKVLFGVATRNYSSSSFVLLPITQTTLDVDSDVTWCLDGENMGECSTAQITTLQNQLFILK